MTESPQTLISLAGAAADVRIIYLGFVSSVKYRIEYVAFSLAWQVAPAIDAALHIRLLSSGISVLVKDAGAVLATYGVGFT